MPTTTIWLLLVIQLMGDGYRTLQVNAFETEAECIEVIRSAGKIPVNIGAGCVPVKIPQA